MNLQQQEIFYHFKMKLGADDLFWKINVENCQIGKIWKLNHIIYSWKKIRYEIFFNNMYSSTLIRILILVDEGITGFLLINPFVHDKGMTSSPCKIEKLSFNFDENCHSILMPTVDF